jgi:hypothetical protein
MATLNIPARVAACGAVLLLAAWATDAGPVKVTVRDEKAVVVRATLPVDPTPRIQFQPQGLTARVSTQQGQNLHLSHFPTFKFDEQIMNGLGQVGGLMNLPLAPGANGKPRRGFRSSYRHGDLKLTFTAELVPGRAKPKADKRQLDTVLLHYEVENKGAKPHKFGLRAFMDVYVVTNDGALFAAPNFPGKILDGVELKGKTLPDYVQLLERPNLNDPGYVAHLTLNLGGKIDRPDRVVLTSLGAQINQWDVRAQQAGGDSALAVFWEPKEIPPGGKREIAYGYGGGIAESAEPDGRFDVQLGGNFEPGKLFTVTAHVYDPAPGQALTVEFPPGLERMEGKSIQPVPPPLPDQAGSVVLWKGRALRHGEFPLRVRSTTGITQTKIITIEPAAGE